MKHFQEKQKDDNMGDIDRNSRKPKPHQEIYRPGSGPLRKSDRPVEEEETNKNYRNANSTSGITENLKRLNICNQESSGKSESGHHKDDRRARRPDNAIYVPRPVAEARVLHKEEPRVVNPIHDVESQGSNNQSNKKGSKRNELRRRKSKRGNKDFERPNQDKVPERSDETLQEKSHNFDRKFSLPDDHGRKRGESYSEERMGYKDKPFFSQERQEEQNKERFNPYEETRFNDKPPYSLARRGSRGITQSKYNSLPPRFKKLYNVEENGQRFSNSSDENWDANSLVVHKNTDITNRDCDPYIPRGRGRGRVNLEQRRMEMNKPRLVPERFARSLTPERLKSALNPPLKTDHRAVSTEIFSAGTKSKENNYNNVERPRRNDDRPPRRDRMRYDERYQRNDERSYRNDERPVRNDERTYRNDDRSHRNGERLLRNEDNSYRHEDRPQRNQERLHRNERPHRNDKRLFNHEYNQPRNEEKPFKNTERMQKNDEHLDRVEDRPAKIDDMQSNEILPDIKERLIGNDDLSVNQNQSSVMEDSNASNNDDLLLTKDEERLSRRGSGKLYNPENDKFEEVTPVEAPTYKASEIVLDWAAEVEMCEELDDSIDDEPFIFAKPAAPPPLMKQPCLPLMKQPLLHQPPIHHQTSHHQPPHGQSSRSRRNRKRSGSRGRHSRRNSNDFGSNNPSRNNSVERGWQDSNWRMRRDEEYHSRQSSVDRGEAWSNSLERRKSRRRRSSERSIGGGGSTGGGGGGGGVGGGGGRRRRSSERSGGGGRRRRSSERSGNGRAPENTNWRLEPRPFEEHPRHQSESIRHQEIPRHDDTPPKRLSDSPNLPENLPSKPVESMKPQGILVLPTPSAENDSPPVNIPSNQPQRQLYNPANPDKPIMISPSRITAHEENNYTYLFSSYPPHFANNMGEQISAGRPLLYANYMEMPRTANYRLVNSMELADSELQHLVSTAIFEKWDRICSLRTFLKDSLKELLLIELKFCETENVEQHFWRILYYNIIELLRKLMTEHPEEKDRCRDLLVSIIDEGREYYESLLLCLESFFKVKFDRVNPLNQELTGFPALSLISAQKLFLFLGDLARYREQAFETSNYGQARQWYLKANQMNPKNGRPYNQLAILAFYTGRKIDAVYYYMRTLIASSPLPSARESLVHIFDENRKKYEADEKKKKEEKAARERERMREKEGSGGGLRREVWVHPGGRKNLHRTSTSSTTAQSYHTDLELLSNIPPAELNKRHSMCYLHTIGKIFTKIGLESLNETSSQMLKEFRALLQHSPVQVKPTRFIQIMALNMFILEITQPKNEEIDSCYRSTLQESALVISLEMFNIILERFLFIIGLDQPTNVSSLPQDCLELLPPIKVWCDWLITHVEVWNPPPSSQDFCIGAGNCWEKLASLVNILERMTQSCDSVLEHSHKEGFEFIVLPENATLAGYAPLMANSEEPVFMRPDTDPDLAQNCLRVHRLLFFGTVFLCGLDPPVLKLHKMDSGIFRYLSIVETTNSQEIGEGEVFIESESESGLSEESEDSGKASGTEEEPSVPTELRELLETRQRLESLARKQMFTHTRKQRLLKEQEIVVEMEIRPKYLLPDTNCFIDYLDLLTSIVKSHPHHPYIVMVPLVVVNELEGLSKVCKPGPSVSHAAHVKEAARAALQILQERQPALKSVTTKGHILNSTTFIFEEDTGPEMKNDDKILATCLNLCHISSKDDVIEGGKRKLYRDVVLLTEDRNLRLKALSRDVPVRELQDFVAWAGLG